MSKNNNQIPTNVLKTLVKVIIFVLVAVMIHRTLSNSYDEFQQAEFDLQQVQVEYLFLSIILYACGLICFAFVWHLALQILGQHPTKTESLGSYFISQLGKYVPGKALVVIIRSERIRSKRTALSPAIVAVFIETLGMMAVGAILAGVLLVCSGYRSTDPQLIIICLGLALMAGIPSAPPVFRAIIRSLTKNRVKGDLVNQVDNLTLSTMIPCWIVSAVGWVLLGASLYACLYSLPNSIMLSPIGISQLGLIIASVALAIVTGFVSLVPGGAGVREYIMLTLLTANFGIVASSLAAILMRVIWLLSEVLFAAFFYILMKRSTPL